MLLDAMSEAQTPEQEEVTLPLSYIASITERRELSHTHTKQTAH